MSADQHLLERRPRESGRIDPDRERELELETDRETGDDVVVVPANERVEREEYVSVALEAARYRHENERLRRRVAELERDLTALRSLRQALVGQYELVLGDHDRDRDSTHRLDTFAGRLRHCLESIRR